MLKYKGYTGPGNPYCEQPCGRTFTPWESIKLGRLLLGGRCGLSIDAKGSQGDRPRKPLRPAPCR